MNVELQGDSENAKYNILRLICIYFNFKRYAEVFLDQAPLSRGFNQNLWLIKIWVFVHKYLVQHLNLKYIFYMNN